MMKLNSLLFLNLLMITRCSTGNPDNLNIQVSSTDSCFWSKTTLSPVTCLTDDGNGGNSVKLNISSQGQCKVYSLNIIKNGNQYTVRINETVEGMRLSLGDCSPSGGLPSNQVVTVPTPTICGLSTNVKVTFTGCSNINAVDPGELCQDATYDKNTCSQNNENKYILTFDKNNNNQKCVTCTERSVLSLPQVNLTDASGRTDPSKASAVMKSLESTMENMKNNNINTAAIVMKDVTGLLYLQRNNTKTKDINMCFSSKEMDIKNCKSDPNKDLSWSVKIPSEAFEKSRQENNGSAFVGVLRFNNMRNENETQNYRVLNNEVYGITMRADISSLTSNIEMSFRNKYLVGKASCSSWDGKGNLSWTTFGCDTKIEGNTVKCSCSHLTFFAVLMDCVNCTGRPAFNLGDDDLTDASGRTDPSKASDVVKSLETKMEEMENDNISTAAIVTGDAMGLLYLQNKPTETKDTCFSSDKELTEFADCQSDLNTDLSWSVKIPREAFDKSRLGNNGSAFVGILPLNMGIENETHSYTILNNKIYGITMRADISNLTSNIEMFFTNKNLVMKTGIASCCSWNGIGNVSWTTFGCKTEKITNTTIKCSCSHLTFFAVLMFPIPEGNATVVEDLETLTLISSIGCGISMFFLSIALFMHFLLRKAKSNQATKVLMNTFVALFLLNLSFLSNESLANSGGETACVFIALLMHYSMLATFTWFFIQALHMYLWLIRKNVSITNYMRKITVFGWVFASPAVIAVVSIGGYKAITLTSSTGKISRMCWITDPLIIYIVNIGFYALVFIFTSGIFITILTRIVQARHIRAADGKRMTFRKLLMMVMSLFLLFGLTWAVAFFSYGPLRTPSFYIFCVLNGLQGFFLFLYYMYIHNDVGGRFSDDPKSSGSITSIISSNTNAVQNVYAN